MNDSELDALLGQPLPERDAGAFSVALMERIAHDAARPARIAAWAMAAVLTVLVTAAVASLGMFAGSSGMQTLTIPSILVLLTLTLSWTVLRSVRE